MVGQEKNGTTPCVYIVGWVDTEGYSEANGFRQCQYGPSRFPTAPCRASQRAASRYPRGDRRLAGAAAWGVLILGLEGRAEMVRGPWSRQLDNQALRGQFAAETFTRSMKRVDRKP